MRAVVVFALAVTGCSSANPCDGVSGACVDVRVEGEVGTLDQLDFAIGLANNMQATKSTSGTGTFSLPVRVAVVPPANAPMPFAIQAQGELAGQVRGVSQVQPVSLGSDGHGSVVLTLSPTETGGDGGTNGDMTGPPPGVVSLNPSTLDFGDTPRGLMSMGMVTTLTNRTDHAISLSGTMPTGDQDEFNTDAAGTTCFPVPDGGMMSGPPMIMLQPGANCTVGLFFLPTRSGAAMGQFLLSFDDGETATLTLKGNALPVWTAEMVNIQQGALSAVWGSSPSDLYAVSQNTAIAFHSTGNGTWSNFGSLGEGAQALFGLDASHVWI